MKKIINTAEHCLVKVFGTGQIVWDKNDASKLIEYHGEPKYQL